MAAVVIAQAAAVTATAASPRATPLRARRIDLPRADRHAFGGYSVPGVVGALATGARPRRQMRLANTLAVLRQCFHSRDWGVPGANPGSEEQ